MMMEHQPPPLLHPIVEAVNNNNNNHIQNQGEVARVAEEENEVGDSDNEQDEHADDISHPSPTFVHTTFIGCPEEKVDIIGRIQIKDFLSKTIEEAGCVNDQFYRRVLQKHPVIATDGKPSSSASGLARNDDFPRYYTYPYFPSKKELSLESKPHQLLDLGRWVARDDFESHLLMDYLCESFSKSLIEEFIEVLPIMTTWNIRTMEVCDVVESLQHIDEDIQATINETDEKDENEEYSVYSASSQGKGRDEEDAAGNTSSSTYADASSDVSSNAHDKCCASFNREETDTSSTVHLSVASCSSQNSAGVNSNYYDSNSDSIKESSLSSPSTTPPPSYHSSSLLHGATAQLAFEVNDDEPCSDLTAVVAASRKITNSSNEFCSGPCCTWKRHCSMYWIKYNMEFVVTQKRTLKSNVPFRRRQQLLQMMKEVAVQRYGLKSNAEGSDTIEANETNTILSRRRRTSSPSGVSGCMRYEILESDYRETSNEFMEIVTWRSSYEYEKQKYEIKKIPGIQKLIRNIDSYFQKDEEEICYWETLVCE